MLDMDFSDIENKVKQAQQVVQEKKETPSVSTKPLKFEITPTSSEVKRTILSIINDRDLTYSDMINYFANNKRPVRAEKQKKKKGQEVKLSEVEIAMIRARKGGNTITALKERDQMYDTTFFDLCDFLELDIILRDRNDPDIEYKVE